MNYKYYPYSNKNIINLPRNIPADYLSNSQIFLHKKNVYGMTSFITGLSKQNTEKFNPNLNTLIPKLMLQWSKIKNIDDFEYVYTDQTQILDFINKDFLKDPMVINVYTDKLTKSDRLNVFRSTEFADNAGHFKKKSYDKMTADEYKNIDVWHETELFSTKNKFRYANQIPNWQKSMNVRHYDKSNSGLHEADPDRASLDVFQRGYDMSNIHKGSEFYNNSEFLNL